MFEEHSPKAAAKIPPFPTLDGQAELDKQKAKKLIAQAESAPLTDGGLHTAELLSEALALDPTNHQAQILRERLYQTFVPRWHFPMLADTARNTAYARAIEAKVQPGDIVLDIGCGAGLTAMLAARAGAKHVYTCECQPLIAEAAKQVIADNGLSDRITVISKWSHDIVVGVDIPEPADLVVSEIVDAMLLGEGALATLTHAMKALAKPDARAIPERGTLMAQLVQSDKLLEIWHPEQAEGFDLKSFHRLANIAQVTPNDLTACGMQPLGPTQDLFDFDFTNPNINPAHTVEQLICTTAGTLHAVFVSFEMDLAEGITVDNEIHSGGHWGRSAFMLDRPCAVTPGEQWTITAQHDASRLSVHVHDERQPAIKSSWAADAWRTDASKGEPAHLPAATISKQDPAAQAHRLH